MLGSDSQSIKDIYAATPVAYKPLLPFWTLLKKEILRICSVAVQTLLVPVTTVSLYLLVFGVSLGERVSVMEDFSYAQFVVPGLLLMGIIQNTFGNVSSSLFMARYLGYVVDYLVTPLSPMAMSLAYTVAAMVRGLVVGIAILFVSLYFCELPWPALGSAVAMALAVSFLFSQLGIIAAIYCNSFDGLSIFNNFLILPAIYLGGLFYPVSMLPQPWASISKVNPLFYMIEGFRGSALGNSDVGFLVCYLITISFALVLFVWATILLKKRGKLQ